MPLAEGGVFAGYSVVRLLGAGSMGEVYLVRHPRLPRQDALRVLPASISAVPQFRERFNREADLAATLRHPHIVAVHERGQFDGRLWISMDYIEGRDAAALSRDRYPHGMPVTEGVEIVCAVAEALDHTHQRKLLHRDVKPANILLTQPNRDGRRRILLADFGITRQTDDLGGFTATNVTVGSVTYTSPEQLLGETVDGRADQYALAATAFHLLTGSPPFSHNNPVVIISRHLSKAPPALSKFKAELSGMDPVVAKALSKNAGDRYPTCRHFARELTQAACESPGPVRATRNPTSPMITAVTPVEPATPITQVVEPTVQHRRPPPVVVSDWAGTAHQADKDVSPPSPLPSLLQIWFDALLILVATLAAMTLVTMLAFITLDKL